MSPKALNPSGFAGAIAVSKTTGYALANRYLQRCEREGLLPMAAAAHWPDECRCFRVGTRIVVPLWAVDEYLRVSHEQEPEP
jgi:hypothetical protein